MTSKIAPRVQRTSLPSPCGAACQCMPRNVCRRSFHETLHCTMLGGKTGGRELLRAPRAGEEAPLVDMPVEVDDTAPARAVGSKITGRRGPWGSAR